MSANLRIFYACLACCSIILFGTVGYVIIEDFPWFEAFYMTIITVTTVGFGETHTLSELGRVKSSNAAELIENVVRRLRLK